MSQFKLQKVTKVKGPSELSIGESTTSSRRTGRSSSSTTERPQTQPTRHKKSTPKGADEKISASGTGSDKSSTAPSRPPQRTRLTAASFLK